jgi:superfamily II DNA/RNA helicase
LTTFADLGLSPELLRALDEAGYQTPTPIQAQAIPHVLMARDLLGCAQTGTGKTAGFVLPMIEILSAGRARARMPRSLILEPTRELAAQVAENFEKYGKYHRFTHALLIGGESMDDQIKKLDRGVDVLIATPGRLLDQFERGNILMSDIKMLVVDECDRMLDMGFIPDIEKIVARIPQQRQTLMFSATLPPEIRRLADKFLMFPKEIAVSAPASAATTVEQALVQVEASDKREVLRALIKSEQPKNAFIFCNRKRDVAVLHKSLTKHGFNAGALHGDMSQPARTETLAKFKADEIILLVCSDVAARGLDVKGVSHVFNFDVPMHAEDYVHRIGRTGRAGTSGRALTLATPEDGKFLSQIEQLIGTTIPRLAVEGFAVEARPEGEESPRRRRGARTEGGRGEGGRGRGREKRVADAPVETVETVEAVEAVQSEAPVAERAPAERAPRERSRRERPAPRQEARPEARAEPRMQEVVAMRDAPRPPRRRYEEDSRDAPVIGFGDDVPAFLRTPRRIAKTA